MKELLYFLFAILFIISCDKQQTVQIKTDISDAEIQALIIGSEVDMFSDTITQFDGTPFDIKIGEEPTIIRVAAGRVLYYVYVEPGSQVVISKGPQDQELQISSNLTAEQDLLAEFSKQMDIANSKYNLARIGQGSEKEFLQVLNKKYEVVNELIAEQNTANISSELVTLLQARIEANEAETKIYYPEYYKYTHKVKPDLSEDFYGSTKDFPFNNDKLFNFEDVKFAALTVLGKGINYEDYENMGDYYAAQYNKVESVTRNQKVSELLKYKILIDKINFAGGISGMENEIDGFISKAQDKGRISVLEDLVAEWAHLKVGKAAPNFTAYNRVGEQVELKDLVGKNLYIDVWATWCGPCIAEIPSLKNMEKKYEDENVEFVSVSIDNDSDRDKWLRFIEEKELAGIQLMVQNAFQSEITAKYNIKGIPRFIMIDAKGNLVNVDAPRPSNASGFEKMMNTVLN